MRFVVREHSQRKFRRIINSAHRKIRGMGKCSWEEAASFIPQTPTEKQEEFLSLECFEALYGGSAGGGKSSCLLMGAIRSAAMGGSSLVLRRTFADLNLPGAIMDRSKEWLGGTSASWNGHDKRWTFPSGGTLQFGYLDTEKDRYRYQGAEFNQIFFDELTQFSEAQYLYLLSRVRKSSNDPIPLLVRSASNPGGVGHDWVYERFVSDKAPAGAVDSRFVPAKLEDNPHIEQDSYRATLEKLDKTTRAQLLEGLWVRDDGGSVYSFTREANLVDVYPEDPDGIRYILGIDLGASRTEATTAFCVVAYSHRIKDKVWICQSYAKSGLYPSLAAEEIRLLQRVYGGFERIVCDAGALGRGYIEEFNRRHSLPVRDAQKRNKLAYRRIINGDFERAAILVVREGNEDLVKELESLQWDSRGMDAQPGQPDHLTDCMLYALREAKAYAAQAPDLPPTDPGEWAVWEEKRMKKELLRKNPAPRKRGAYIGDLNH